MNNKHLINEIKKPEFFNSMIVKNIELKENYITFYFDIEKNISFKDLLLYFKSKNFISLINWDHFDYFGTSTYIFQFYIIDEFYNQYISNQKLIEAILDEFGFNSMINDNKLLLNNVV